jgi:2-oxoisovalerate dehydrogenase E1 component alpha subunit
VEQVREAGREAEKDGVLGAEGAHSAQSMFEDVYKEMPWHLQEQRKQLEV